MYIHKPITELGFILLGAITSTTIGTFIFNALGAFILGIMGAAGGYIFVKLIKPRLDKLFAKKAQ